jgi:glycosyltransferase involved in cell wall biosynthesis
LLREWRSLAQRLRVDHHLTWRTDEPALTEWYGALDALCLPSRSEGFSNVLAEAMACGLPCIATEVGDAALILGDTGQLVPPDDAEALARALLRVTSALTPAMASLRRARILDHFSVDRLIENTYAILYGAQRA